MAAEGCNDAAAAPLLEKKKVYYQGCPGCRIDQKKDTNPGIPYAEFVYVWIVTLCTALPISSLFPFLYFMIKDLHIAKSEEDIGYYAGYVGSSFMLGRALTSVFWGIVADRYGRKPVIVIGIISVVIFNTIFGLSTSFWMAISTRFLLGSLNGLLGPIKAYSSEVCRPEHQSIGLSLVSTAWGIGLIIGPAIGGYLAQPADKYPAMFSKDSLFVRFPYFLPCLFISAFAACVLIACIWLPETLHKHGANQDLETYESQPFPECFDSKKSINQSEGQSTGSKESLLSNWPLMSSIIVYCVFSLHDMAYTEIFSLWAVSDKKYGGLTFSSEDVGQVLAVSGFSLLVFQLSLYPPVERLLGPVVTSRIGAVLSIPLLFSYPYFSKLSGFTLKFVVNCASLMKNILSVCIITGLFILQNDSVKQQQRGAANGVSMTAMSLFKAVAPAGGGAIFALAQRRQNSYFLPGDQLVFFILNLVELLGLVLTFKFFLALPKN